LRIQCLTCEYGIQIVALHRWPQQTVLDNIAGIVLVLIVDKQSIYEPTDLRLRPTYWNTKNKKKTKIKKKGGQEVSKLVVKTKNGAN